MRVCLLVLFSVTVQMLFAQEDGRTLYGKVLDEQGKAITGASVFLSHTSKGVTTSGAGEFRLRNLPDGKYDLVISAIGYETRVLQVSSDKYPAGMNVQLSKKAMDLDDVVVRPSDNNGWRNHGKYFTDNFIGTTRNAKFCKILNRDVLRFRFSEKNNTLTVKADEPVVIENKALGYKISFQLVEFVADFDAGTVAYYGHPLFVDMQESSPTETVKNNRQRAFRGSLTHFVRAVFDDRLSEEGFVVKAPIVRPNLEKIRIRQLFEDTARRDGQRYHINTVSAGTVNVSGSYSDSSVYSADSIRYYRKVLKERDTIFETATLHSLNNMITSSGADSKFLFFRNSMDVIFTDDARKSYLSQISLQTPRPIEILKNGSYFSPTELVTYKHWSDIEKMCNMLPLDYIPD